MEDNVTKKYKCAVCGTAHDTIQQRSNCETLCLKKKAEEEKKAAEERKKVERASRKKEVDTAFNVFIDLLNKYTADYGTYEFENDVGNGRFYPSRLWKYFL